MHPTGTREECAVARFAVLERDKNLARMRTGSCTHTYSAYARGLDALCALGGAS